MKKMTPKDLVTVRELYSLVDEKMSSLYEGVGKIEERLGRVEVRQGVMQETIRIETRNAAILFSAATSIILMIIGSLITYFLKGGVR